MEHQSYQNEVVAYNDLPPIRPRDKNENQNDTTENEEPVIQRIVFSIVSIKSVASSFKRIINIRFMV